MQTKATLFEMKYVGIEGWVFAGKDGTERSKPFLDSNEAFNVLLGCTASGRVDLNRYQLLRREILDRLDEPIGRRDS